MKKWHVAAILIAAIVLGVWLVPVVPSTDEDQNQTIDTIPAWLTKHLVKKRLASPE
jgi:hypothetical protein